MAYPLWNLKILDFWSFWGSGARIEWRKDLKNIQTRSFSKIYLRNTIKLPSGCHTRCENWGKPKFHSFWGSGARIEWRKDLENIITRSFSKFYIGYVLGSSGNQNPLALQRTAKNVRILRGILLLLWGRALKSKAPKSEAMLFLRFVGGGATCGHRLRNSATPPSPEGIYDSFPNWTFFNLSLRGILLSIGLNF